MSTPREEVASVDHQAVGRRSYEARKGTRARVGIALGLAVLGGAALARWVGITSSSTHSGLSVGSGTSARAGLARAPTGISSVDLPKGATTTARPPWIIDPRPGEQSRGGDQLSGAQLHDTVARYQAALKRRCWHPARDARGKDAPLAVRIHLVATIAKNGSVTDVTTSGDPRGYPGLASCLARAARAWHFPAARATTLANLPFVFSLD